ncbi:MAG: hypothetical protein Q9216_002730 [Gyalolechia sp. 2 TL-2023]
MVSKGGVALRGVTTFLRSVELLGSVLVLGITSYWLGVLTHRNASIPTWMKAVEGMAGGAVIYTGFAVILTCFLGGFTFFAFLAVLLDILFVGAFVAIAILTRKKQPFWKRKRGTKTSSDAHDLATYGSSTQKKQPFWKRNKKTTRDAELGAAGTSALIAEEKHRHNNARTSHETGVTGTTAASSGPAHSTPVQGYGNDTNAPYGNHAQGGAELAGPTNTYQPYREGATTGHHQTQVVHDQSPYAEVHHGGHPHAVAPTEYPSTFGHSGYQAR